LLKYYSQFSLDFVWDELPMGEGYAYLTVAIGLDGWAQFSGLKPEGETYLEQETNQLMEQAKKLWQLK
jgi:hypothetical protein